MAEKIIGFLQAAKNSSQSGQAQYYNSFEDLFDRKLWHQLTKAILEFIEKGSFEEGDELLQLYSHFVTDFERKINTLALVQIALAASKQHKDLPGRIEFLKQVAAKVKETPESHVMLSMEIAAHQLQLGDVASCKAAIEESEKTLDSLPGVEPVIHASFYRVYSAYDQARGNYDGYYKNSLLYLACVPLESLSQQEKVERTYHLGIAALLGQSIYNFGELLAHDILACLEGTEHEWLVRALRVFNSGDIQAFESIAPQLQKEPLLAKNMSFLEQKIRLMCLIEIIFHLSGDKRNLTLGSLAEGTKLPEDNVEFLLMKAMSLKLIKGVIDQVEGVVNVTWVQPRVLDKIQIKALRDRLELWSASVSKTVLQMESDSPDLFVQ